MATTNISSSDFLGFNDNTGAVQLPSGTTAQRPSSPSNGEMRYNTTDNKVEYYDGAQWISMEVYMPPLEVNYVVIAAGAGTGGGSGGAGAGGLRTSYPNTSTLNGHNEAILSLSTSTNYTVTIGAGGTAGSYGGSNPTNGNNTTFDTITSTGGGTGGYIKTGSPTYISGSNGGSGGGGSMSTGRFNGSAVTTPVTQGYAGGFGDSNFPIGFGSGGGANGAGSAASSGGAVGGPGGVGLVLGILNTTNATSSSVGEVSGSDVYYAGGGGGTGQNSVGGGGAGGLGGGGDGGFSSSDPGAANTGGGAGGCRDTTTGSNGGSGVVLLRYPKEYSVTVGAGIIEASGSPFTEGVSKISIFTAGTGNISFS